MLNIPSELIWHEWPPARQIGIVRFPEGEVILLSASAADIWLAADGCDSVQDVVAVLANALDVKPSEIAADVQRCVDDMLATGLLERRGADDDDR